MQLLFSVLEQSGIRREGSLSIAEGNTPVPENIKRTIQLRR